MPTLGESERGAGGALNAFKGFLGGFVRRGMAVSGLARWFGHLMPLAPGFFNEERKKGDVGGRDAADAARLTNGRGSNLGKFLPGFRAETADA